MTSSVSVYYQRPGKGLTIYEEDCVREDETCLRTFKQLPDDVSEHLSAALQKQGLIPAGQRVFTIAKVYFFNEPFDLLEFRDSLGNLMGYYSDIGEPTKKLGPGKYEMTDLFLDIWLAPDGALLELDWDEFEEAILKGVINNEQADMARAAMQRLKTETAHKIYPAKYLTTSL